LGDLKAAKSFGLKAIYVQRPHEDRELTAEDAEYVDLSGDSFIQIARLLKVE
jgi:hypothetical protein